MVGKFYNTAAKIAFEHYMKEIKKRKGPPQETLSVNDEEDLHNIGLTWENAIELTENRR